MPLVAPKFAFAHRPWWVVFSEGVLLLRKTLGPRDYMFPAPTRDHMGVRPEPIKSSCALKWFRDLLVQGGLPAELAAMQSLAGLRVFMPELAFRHGIPRDQRRYLGRWMNDTMADTYTREHKNVVYKIWETIMNAPAGCEEEKDLKENGVTVPVEITSAHYDLAQPPVEGGLDSTDGVQGEARPAQAASEPPPVDWTLISLLKKNAGGKEDCGSNGDDGETPGTKPAFAGLSFPKDTIPADEVPSSKGGPLFLSGNKKKTRAQDESHPTRKAHLLRMTRRTVCGKTISTDNMTEFTCREDWARDAGRYVKCKICFKFFEVPVGWPIPGEDPPEPGTLDADDTDSDDMSILSSIASSGIISDLPSDSDADEGSTVLPVVESGG